MPERDLRDLIDWGRERGTRFTVRLVKGAYWDYEKIKAAQNGWRCPVFLQKPESDANFETLHAHSARERSDRDRRPSVRTTCAASRTRRRWRNNSASIRAASNFSCSTAWPGPIKRALVEMGYRVREYCPVGELLPGMSYLVRRLLENTSNEGFLRAKFSDNVSAAELAARSERTRSGATAPSRRTRISRLTLLTPMARALDTPPGDTYENAPLVNFVHQQSQEKMRDRARGSARKRSARNIRS